MQTMHLLPGVAIQPNLELKTQPKLVLGSLPLAFALPTLPHDITGQCMQLLHGLCCFDFVLDIPLPPATLQLVQLLTKDPKFEGSDP
jgi:hypothetical protein